MDTFNVFRSELSLVQTQRKAGAKQRYDTRGAWLPCSVASLMSSVPTVTLTKKELESKWKDLLGATLEAWAHMILFVRQVYPAESFCSPPTTTLFGLRLHHNRHPAVAAYIAEAVKVALPSLTSRVADSITLTIIETNPPLLPADDQQPPPRYDWLSQAHLEMTDVNDDDEEEEGNRFGQQSPVYHQQQHQQEEEKEIIQPEPLVLEKFELRFPQGQQEEGHQHNGIHSGSHRPIVYTLSAVDYLEREMRAILLSVYAMKDADDVRGDSAPSESESLSFTISLHVPEANASCEALDRAVATGEWRNPPVIVLNHPNPSTTQYSGGPRTTTDHPKTPYVMRPLHTMDALTSPVGPVQFVVKYPRPVGQRLSRRGGGPKRHRRSRHGSPDSSSTQSTPTLDF
jgi:hypothetical protein